MTWETGNGGIWAISRNCVSDALPASGSGKFAEALSLSLAPFPPRSGFGSWNWSRQTVAAAPKSHSQMATATGLPPTGEAHGGRRQMAQIVEMAAKRARNFRPPSGRVRLALPHPFHQSNGGLASLGAVSDSAVVVRVWVLSRLGRAHIFMDCLDPLCR